MVTRRRALQLMFLTLGLAFGGGLLVFLIWRTGWNEFTGALVGFGLLPLAGFVTISLLNFCLYTLRWKVILDDMIKKELRIPFHRLFMHRMSGYAAGYLTPAAQVAGEPVRVAMLRTDGIPLKEATGSVVLDLAFEITSFVVYVIAGIVLALVQGLGAGGDLLWPLLFVVALLGFLVAFFIFTASGAGFFHHAIGITGLRRLKAMAKFEKWLEEMEGLMSQFFTGKGLVVMFIVFLSFIMTAFKAVEVAYIANFFGASIELRDAFLMSTLPGVALLLPVPGGLGVFEGSNAALFTVLGLSINAVAFTMIVRARDFLFIALGVIHAIQRGESLVGGGSSKIDRRT